MDRTNLSKALRSYRENRLTNSFKEKKSRPEFSNHIFEFEENISRLERGNKIKKLEEKASLEELIEYAKLIEEKDDLNEGYFIDKATTYSSSTSLLRVGIPHFLVSAPFIALILETAHKGAMVSSYLSDDGHPKFHKTQDRLILSDEQIDRFVNLKFDLTEGSRSFLHSHSDLKKLLVADKFDCIYTHEKKGSYRKNLLEIGTVMIGVDAVVKPIIITSKSIFDKLGEYLEKAGRIDPKENDPSADRFEGTVYNISDFLAVSDKLRDTIDFKVVSLRDHLTTFYVNKYFNDELISQYDYIELERIEANNLFELISECLQLYDVDFEKEQMSDEKSIKDAFKKIFVKNPDNPDNRDIPNDKILFLFHSHPHLHWIKSLLKEFNNENNENEQYFGVRIIETSTLFSDRDKEITSFHLYANKRPSFEILKKIMVFVEELQGGIEDLKNELRNHRKRSKSVDLEEVAKYLDMNIEPLVAILKKLNFRFSYSPDFVDYFLSSHHLKKEESN